MEIRRVRGEPTEMAGWARMRADLWPDTMLEEHQAEMTELLSHPQEAAFVAAGDDGQLKGFAEASIRRDYVEGCATQHVGYLEGWYVIPEARRKGVGRALVLAVEAWAREQGCVEMGSDTELENMVSQLAHGRLGYEEAARIVHFRKTL